jgi:hypothetical protein
MPKHKSQEGGWFWEQKDPIFGGFNRKVAGAVDWVHRNQILSKIAGGAIGFATGGPLGVVTGAVSGKVIGNATGWGAHGKPGKSQKGGNSMGGFCHKMAVEQAAKKAAKPRYHMDLHPIHPVQTELQSGGSHVVKGGRRPRRKQSRIDEINNPPAHIQR